MVLVDHIAIIERIIEILKADDTIFDKGNPQGKLRKILVAESDAGIIDDSTPYAWVAISSRFRMTREGTGTGETGFDQSLVEYHIAIVVQRKDAATTQKELLKFEDLVVNALRANPQLKEPVGLTDPKVKRINVLRSERFFPQQGRALDAVRIILAAQVGVEFELEIPGESLTLGLISKPLDEDNINVDLDLTDNGVIALTKISDPGSLDVEFESDTTIDGTLKGLISGDLEHTVNVKRGGSTIRTLTVKFLSLRKPVPYDNIEKTILSMQIIQ